MKRIRAKLAVLDTVDWSISTLNTVELKQQNIVCTTKTKTSLFQPLFSLLAKNKIMELILNLNY